VVDIHTVRNSIYQYIRHQIFPFLEWQSFEASVSYWIHDLNTQQAFGVVLPTAVFNAFGDDITHSFPVSAFWTLNTMAARVFDDIQDQQGQNSPWNSQGVGYALTTGIGALTSANICLSQLDADHETVRDILNMFGKIGTLAAKAQSLPPHNQLSLNAYFDFIISVTANAFAAGAWAGGRLKTTDETILDALYQFGHNLGIASAIINDCRDLNPNAPDKKSDLFLNLYTLPVIYALSLTEHPHHADLMKLLSYKPINSDLVDQVIFLLEEMNAITWCAQMTTVFKQKAYSSLNCLPEKVKQKLIRYVEEQTLD